MERIAQGTAVAPVSNPVAFDDVELCTAAGDPHAVVVVAGDVVAVGGNKTTNVTLVTFRYFLFCQRDGPPSEDGLDDGGRNFAEETDQ